MAIDLFLSYVCSFYSANYHQTSKTFIFISHYSVLNKFFYYLPKEMPLRDRTYEKTLQLILGGIIALAVLFSVVQSIASKFKKPYEAPHSTSLRK
ncbi:MAG: hypothetical protein JWR50_2156 [Mucilaginibacter sp.]|nr:hypothetical protein [Mucilaginibacter sp.]